MKNQFWVVVKEKKDSYRQFLMGGGQFSETVDFAFKFHTIKDAKFFIHCEERDRHVEKWLYSVKYGRYVMVNDYREPSYQGSIAG